MGRLTGKYSSENPPPSGRRFASQYTWKQLDPLIALLREIATKYNVTPSAIAINWVMMKGAIPLGGARDGKQAEQNASAMTFRLTEEEMSKLDASGFEGTT
jgi:aryl-alcohol dehydrogenase-like predicted oxidoreductase